MATCCSHLSHEWWKLSHTVKLTSVRYYLINLIVFNLPKLTISSNKQKRTHYSSLTLDIIGKTAFDHDFHALDSIEKWATLDNRKNDQILNLGNRKQNQAFDFRLPPLRLFFGILGLGKFDFITKRSNAKLDKVVDEIIDNAKAKVAQQKICEKIQRNRKLHRTLAALLDQNMLKLFRCLKYYFKQNTIIKIRQ